MSDAHHRLMPLPYWAGHNNVATIGSQHDTAYLASITERLLYSKTALSQDAEITVACTRNSLIETRFLHNTQKFLFVYLTIAITISLINHLLYVNTKNIQLFGILLV